MENDYGRFNAFDLPKYRVVDRVEARPGTDQCAMGDRYGEIKAIRVSRITFIPMYTVHMDKSDRHVSFTDEDILRKVDRGGKFTMEGRPFGMDYTEADAKVEKRYATNKLFCELREKSTEIGRLQERISKIENECFKIQEEIGKVWGVGS